MVITNINLVFTKALLWKEYVGYFWECKVNIGDLDNLSALFHGKKIKKKNTF